MKFCQYIITKGTSKGLRCGTPLIATCDRSQPSELTEFKGRDWTEKHPQTMMMYPEAEEQDNLCFYHKQKQIEDKIGKET